MKCPICNFENQPSATRCEKCGYGFIQVTWPETPTLEFPQPEWPPLSGLTLEIPPAPAAATLPAGEAASEPVEHEMPSDDKLARMHISRGLEALRQGLVDQAYREFEQARQLAKNLDIIRMAEAQLRELQQRAGLPEELTTSAESFVERLEQKLEQRRSGKEELPQKAHKEVPEVRPDLTGPVAQVDARPAPAALEASDLRLALSTGLVIGMLNGVIAGCGAAVCLGFLVSPVLGLAAGWLAAQGVGRKGPLQGIAAGAITGLVGWIGEMVGYAAWSSSKEASTSMDALPVVACMTLLFIPASAVAGLLGWRMRTSRQSAAT
jgi:hypothetical protein